ncbi:MULTISPECIES: ATP-binding protein [unclassified Streptomyces]|uniref:ATP-binding protein n=1 Tax=unclassified Streptomyces TaxID=2593676 RepID=UPI0036C8CB5E
MELVAGAAERQLGDEVMSVSGLFEGNEDIAGARHLAGAFLDEAQTVHGVCVSERARGAVELVVSELVTNARKYAPGPCLLTLEIAGGTVEVTVWDSSPALPVLLGPDPTRIGRHGLEIVTALGQSFSIHREPVGKRITTVLALADETGAGGWL